MTGTKYDWNVAAGASELSLEIEAAYSTKSDIDDQTIGTVGHFGEPKRGRRIEAGCLISH
jgi:hypothetical protein